MTDTILVPVAATGDALTVLLDIEVAPMAKLDADVMRVTREALAEFDRDLTVDGGVTVRMDAGGVAKAVAVLRMARLRAAFAAVPALWRALAELDPFQGN